MQLLHTYITGVVNAEYDCFIAVGTVPLRGCVRSTECGAANRAAIYVAGYFQGEEVLFDTKIAVKNW